MYKQFQGGIGIPKLYWYGIQGDYNILIRQLLDDSLDVYFKSCNNKFSLLTTLMLADQMLSRIEFIHSRNYIHGNIKPAYFLMGRGLMKNRVYIIPYRGSKRYRVVISGLHIPYKEGLGLRSTINFASINKLKGNEVSRRDDIEGLGYTLLYFLKGSLPWNNIKAKTSEERVEKVKEIKMNTSLAIICNGCPEEFITFIRYSRDLKFEHRPDYNYLRKILEQIRKKNNLIINYEFDWLLKNNNKK
jgi:casein kinase 1